MQDLQRMVDRVAAKDSVTLPFPLLSDPDHRVIDRYGLFNPAEPKGRPVPHPATYVIDKEGVVQWKMVEINYKIRPTNEDILAALTRLGTSNIQHRTSNVQLPTSNI